LTDQGYLNSVTPHVSTSVTARFGNVEATATVSGVNEQYFQVKGLQLVNGAVFDGDAVLRLGQVAVISSALLEVLRDPCWPLVRASRCPSCVIRR
jgi:macrolide transport system ATP-binding/permease protein